jgi:hypothetical protein
VIRKSHAEELLLAPAESLEPLGRLSPAMLDLLAANLLA